MKEIRQKSDAVVVGTGAGGGPFAKELAESGFSVVILERGGDFPKLGKGESLFDGAVRVFSSTRAFRVTPVIGRPNMIVGYGFCVGGSTAINAGTCFRPPPWVLKKWREEGLEIFTEEYVDRIAERVESFLPIKVVDEKVMGMSGKVFERGLKELGWSGGPVKRNADGCQGCGVCVAGCPLDAKKATHLSYIPSALKAGARLYRRAKAEKIVLKDGKVTGVEAIYTDERDRKWKLIVECEVVGIGAGAVHTPLLIKKSLGRETPQVVGRNFHLHPGGVVGAIFDEEIKCWRGVPQSYYCDQFLREGMILLVGAIPPPLAANLVPGFGMSHKALMAKYTGFTDAGVLISDSTGGEVKSIGGIPFIKYRLADEDLRRLKRGLVALAEIYFAAGAKYVFPLAQRGFIAKTLKEFVEGVDRIKKEEMICGSIHPMGTARMGVDINRSFVNQFLECHTVKGLFVIDASVLPTSTVVNPQETIMILSTHAAFHLIKR